MEGSMTNLKNTGLQLVLHSSIAGGHEDDWKRVIISLTDVTDYKNLEAQLQHSQRMESIGTLVGGIAHDFNNMLGAIQANLFLIRYRLESPDFIVEKIDDVEALTNRAADMVSQMLAFARKDRVQMSTLEFEPFVKTATNLARTGIPENVAFVANQCGESLFIQGDATQLQQVLMNLLNNAVAAVSGLPSPRIEMSTGRYHADSRFLRANPEVSATEFARVSIRDNGCGIRPENLARIFEPFYTTKEVGKGTGLGLAMAYGAVHSHGGVIEVESEPGAGSVFHVYIPLQDMSEGQHRPEVARSAPVLGKGETILLVDDEPAMRSATAELLGELGYRVFEAENGEEALQVYSAHRDEIDIVVTDVVMPKMGGVVMAGNIRSMDAGLPVIFATGYDRNQITNEIQALPRSAILNKPVNIHELTRLIHTLIDVS